MRRTRLLWLSMNGPTLTVRIPLLPSTFTIKRCSNLFALALTHHDNNSMTMDFDVDSEARRTSSLLGAIDISKLSDTDSGSAAFVFENISKSDMPSLETET